MARANSLSIVVDVLINVPDLTDITSRMYVKAGKIMEKELDIMENSFKPTYRNWSPESKPIWVKRFGNPSRLIASAKSGGSGGVQNISGLSSFVKDDFAAQIHTQSTPFIWVSGGTRGGNVRFSKDYRAMTRPRVLGSRRRQGVATHPGRRIKGIRARNFEFEVAFRRRAPFVKAVSKAINADLIRLLTKGKRIVIHGRTSG